MLFARYPQGNAVPNGFSDLLNAPLRVRVGKSDDAEDADRAHLPGRICRSKGISCRVDRQIVPPFRKIRSAFSGNEKGATLARRPRISPQRLGDPFDAGGSRNDPPVSFLQPFWNSERMLCGAWLAIAKA
jgi:hypothetical protein